MRWSFKAVSGESERARLIGKIFPQGLNKLRKKAEQKVNLSKGGLAGAEARLILLIVSARLKPCPYYKALRLSFSAGCKTPRIEAHFRHDSSHPSDEDLSPGTPRVVP
jgi:hypothetical protein